MTPHNLQINHIIHYCEANDIITTYCEANDDHTITVKLMTHHNLQINHIIHYCEANDTSQPTNKSYHTLL